MDPSRRRHLLAAAGALLAPSLATAQRKKARVGLTIAGAPPNAFANAFGKGLAELGWIEGKNLQLEVRYAEGRPERYRDFMAASCRSSSR